MATSLVSCSKAEVVECPIRDPCWSEAGNKCVLTVVSMRASITFAAGQSSEIGRYEVPCRLQTTQHTSSGAVTADSSCCANCVEPSRNGGPIHRFSGMPAMRTCWVAGTAAHKSG